MNGKSSIHHYAVIKVALIMAGVISLSACAPKMEREFKQGCRASGGNRDVCSCIYDQIENHYGEETMKNIGEEKQLPPAGLEEQIFQYAVGCVNKFK